MESLAVLVEHSTFVFSMVSKAHDLKMPIVVLLGLMFAICSDVLGQDKGAPKTKRNKPIWHVFSPPDRSFTIETPKPFQYAKDLEYNWLEVYGSQPSESEACHNQYGVAVGTFDDKDRPNGDLSGWYLLIGGSHTEPTTETDIIVRGLKAKDVVYSRPFDSGCKYRRGWIIDAGKHIYWLIYQDDFLEGLSSPSAMRFFKSFRLNTKGLKSKRATNKSHGRE